MGIDAERIPTLARELSGILAHMEALQQIPLDHEALAEAEQHPMPLRQDSVDPVPLTVPRASFAPAMRDEFFLVPRVATHHAAGGASSSLVDSE
ncbi:MAG: aspartyl/glutamyl-tRNA amidotransferase subunit C [Gemmatimonadaceae bacterium]|nr:aspartyl/glutamyl-tRNA amidotransferase subunit C [Gemmatimonadaceae bacterium]